MHKFEPTQQEKEEALRRIIRRARRQGMIDLVIIVSMLAIIPLLIIGVAIGSERCIAAAFVLGCGVIWAGLP